jgi:DNA-binding CsgD family transcriptional regulator
MSASGNDHGERRNISEKIYTLWDELADHGPQETDQALRHCMNEICQLIGADDAGWYGMVRLGPECRLLNGKRIATKYDFTPAPPSSRDPMGGWRIGVIVRLQEISAAAERRRYKTWQAIEDKLGDTSRAIASMAGQFRAHTLLGGLVDMAEFQTTEHYDQLYRKRNISDRLWVLFPVTDDSESCFVFDKLGKGKSFDSNEVRTVMQCMRGIKWFHRNALLSHGLGVSNLSLTPKERDVLSQLLTGDSEKEIARKFGITPGSAHQYCVSIYQKYGVRGRLELMALWLN